MDMKNFLLKSILIKWGKMGHKKFDGKLFLIKNFKEKIGSKFFFS